MAYNIIIQGGFFVIQDDATSVEIIRNPREVTVFTCDSSDVFRFFYKSPRDYQQKNIYQLGSGLQNTFNYADLLTITEDGNAITVANVDELKEYLSNKLGFFFNQLNYDTALALGKVTGQEALTRDAVSYDIGNTYLDIWGGAADLVYETSATTWEIVSDNANDTLLGTGARRIMVRTLDANYNIQEQVVEMNGTTPVALTGTHYRPDIMIVTEAGSFTANEGLITLRAVTGANPQGYILTREAESKSSHFSVPAGKTLLIKGAVFFVGKGFETTFALVISGESTNFVQQTSSFGSIYQATFKLQLVTPKAVPEKTDIRVLGRSTNPATPCGLLLEYTLIDN